MSFLSNVFSRPAPAAPQQAPTNPQQSRGDAGTMQFQAPQGGAGAPNPNGATMPNDPNNKGNQGNNPNPQGDNKAIDPFAAYSKMFDNTANAEVAPTFTIDDKVLGSVAASQDFMKGINPDLVQRASTGDMSAVMEMMNEVARNAYKTSLQHGGKLTEGFVGSRESFSDKGFTTKVRGELTANALTGTPNFKNPVVRKQLIEIANNLQRQHPDAPPEEIAQMSRDYITTLSKAISSDETQTTGKPNRNEPTDFGDWFDRQDNQED